MPRKKRPRTARDRVAANLAALRTAAGLSQAAAAERAGLRQATWSDAETARKLPSLETLDAMAAALGVDVAELLR